jgi:hypothetical protein
MKCPLLQSKYFFFSYLFMFLSLLIVARINTQPIRFDPRSMCDKTFAQSFDNGRVSRQNARNKLCKTIEKPEVPTVRKPLRVRRPQ